MVEDSDLPEQDAGRRVRRLRPQRLPVRPTARALSMRLRRIAEAQDKDEARRVPVVAPPLFPERRVPPVRQQHPVQQRQEQFRLQVRPLVVEHQALDAVHKGRARNSSFWRAAGDGRVSTPAACRLTAAKV